MARQLAEEPWMTAGGECVKEHRWDMPGRGEHCDLLSPQEASGGFGLDGMVSLDMEGTGNPISKDGEVAGLAAGGRSGLGGWLGEALTHFPGAAVLSSATWLAQSTGVCWLTPLEARSPNQGVCVVGSSCSRPLPSLLVAPWLMAPELHSLYGLLPVCVSVSRFPIYGGTPVRLD